jgi:hypothetical protein
VCVCVCVQIRFPELSAAGFQPCTHSPSDHEECTALNIVAFEKAWKAMDEYVEPSKITHQSEPI